MKLHLWATGFLNILVAQAKTLHSQKKKKNVSSPSNLRVMWHASAMLRNFTHKYNSDNLCNMISGIITVVTHSHTTNNTVKSEYKSINLHYSLEDLTWCLLDSNAVCNMVLQWTCHPNAHSFRRRKCHKSLIIVTTKLFSTDSGVFVHVESISVGTFLYCAYLMR